MARRINKKTHTLFNVSQIIINSKLKKKFVKLFIHPVYVRQEESYKRHREKKQCKELTRKRWSGVEQRATL